MSYNNDLNQQNDETPILQNSQITQEQNSTCVYPKLDAIITDSNLTNFN